MRRIVAFVLLILVAGLSPALCQSNKEREPVAPAKAPSDPLPASPMDVPRWMGQAIENILTGDAPPRRAAPENTK
jgi:hypothetical protein